MKKKQKTIEATLHFESNESMRGLLGVYDENLKAIEELMGVSIHARGNKLTVYGVEPNAVKIAENVLNELYVALSKGWPVDRSTVESTIKLLSANKNATLEEATLGSVIVTHRGRTIAPKTAGQKSYINAINENDMVFGIGPAGTGKTFLAMACAVSALLKGEFSRIILTRPAVEAGEKLGFLPGDMLEKVDPYLRPLFDALHEMVDMRHAMKMIEEGRIEVAPLAFMRGRTLDSAFVILDEAQNCTSAQMKMFLTRLGVNSKIIVTADVTQIDLPTNTVSGALEVQRVLKDVPGICFHYLSEEDVVRHRLVQAIIKAYEEDARHEKN